jgi:hypothetical protein
MWIYSYDVEIKWKSLRWKSRASPFPKKALEMYMRSQMKVIWLFLFRPWKGIAHYVLDLEGQTINHDWRFWDVCGIRYEESYLKCGLWEAGSSVTIMRLLTPRCHLSKSWKTFNSYPSTTRSIHLTSTISICFYSLNSKLPLKWKDFRQWKSCSLIGRMAWRRYHKHPLNGSSKTGKGDGKGALLGKGTNLNEIIF